MINRSLSKSRCFIIACIFTTTVVLTTHLPPEVFPIKLPIRGLDKIAHILAYGLITFLFLLSFRASFSIFFVLFLLLTIISSAAFDELTQSFVNRTASLDDWLADKIGIVVALYVFIYINYLNQRTSMKAK